MGPLLQALRRLLGGGMAPAVFVTLAVRGPREVGELVGEGALAELLSLCGQPEAVALDLEIALVGEAHEELADGRGRHREEARKLGGGRALGEALGAHPVHRLQHLVANLERLELAHQDPPLAPAVFGSPFAPTSLAIAAIALTAALSGSKSRGELSARSASTSCSSKGTVPPISWSCLSANSLTAANSLSSRTLFAIRTTRFSPRPRASSAIRRPVSSDLK